MNTAAYKALIAELSAKGVTLVAVSKTKPVEEIKALYKAGQRDFGENYVQEMVGKQQELSSDIRWHYIGHLQSNKVKYISSFVHLVHGVDSIRLLIEINKQGAKQGRVIDCLLQVHIAQEETKFGMDEEELDEAIRLLSSEELKSVRVKGLMGMASFTEDEETVRTEFRFLKKLFDKYSRLQGEAITFTILSMGMSADYQIAVEEGSNMVRIGSLIFGER